MFDGDELAAGAEEGAAADVDGGDVEDDAVEVQKAILAECGVHTVFEVQRCPDLRCYRGGENIWESSSPALEGSVLPSALKSRVRAKVAVCCALASAEPGMYH